MMTGIGYSLSVRSSNARSGFCISTCIILTHGTIPRGRFINCRYFHRGHNVNMPSLPVEPMPQPQFNEIKARLQHFMKTHIYPNEQLYLEQCEEIMHRGNEWSDPPILRELKQIAKQQRLWNLWLPTDSAKVHRAPKSALLTICRI